jgi:hypothetical protein
LGNRVWVSKRTLRLVQQAASSARMSRPTIGHAAPLVKQV